MILLSIILPVLSILFAFAALITAIAALAMVIGLKNSTHQVVWKPVEDPKTPTEKSEDPFFTVEDEIQSFPENPNRRQKREKTDEPFVDLDDPTLTSANW